VKSRGHSRASGDGAATPLVTVPRRSEFGAPPAMAWVARFLFGQSTAVLALPNWEQPRLLVAAEELRERWRGSGSYPAYRARGRLYRAALRLKAAAGVGTTRFDAVADVELRDLIGTQFHDARVRSVIVGMPGGAQKMTATLAGPAGEVVAYLKCASTPLGRTRLAREHELLGALSPGIGPAPLGYRRFDLADVLLLSPVAGRPVPSTLPACGDVERLASRLAHVPSPSTSYRIDAHPWVRTAFEREPGLEPHLDALSARTWPVVVQHGDFAPWNILSTRTGGAMAVDWELGRWQGFPDVDFAQYMLQVGCLMYRWSPQRTLAVAVRELVRRGFTSPSDREARAIVNLAASDAYHSALEEGHAPERCDQSWRRTLMEHSS
jgi:hypothetical protein